MLSKNTLTNAIPCESKPSVLTRSGTKGGITIVSSKNGTRLEFSNTLYEALGKPAFVGIFFLNDSLVLKKTDDAQAFPVKNMKRKQVVYCTSLIHEITRKFNLDFSEHCCKSFSEYDKVEGTDNVLVVKIIKKGVEE